MPQTDVLIIGAGPTGLVLALWLTRLGTKVRIIDKTAEPGTTSRALAVQARTALSCQRKHGQEIGLVEIDMQLAIHRCACGLDVGDVKEVTVGAARKAGADCLPHGRTRAVAADDISRLAVVLLAVRPTQPRQHAALAIGEADQFGPPFDCDAERVQTRNQQPLMLVLGKNMQERVGR